MSAMEELVCALVSGGMVAGAAASLVARAVIEAAVPARSKAALRTQRWRDRKAAKREAETVTNRHAVTPPELPIEPSQTVTNRHSVTVPLSKKDLDRSSTSPVTRKRTSLPDGFLLSEKMLAYAQSKGLDPPRITREFERFCDHHRAKGSLFADWEAAWRTWVGRAADYAPKGGGNSGGYRWNGIEGVT